jgi:hypothetical protein
VPHPVHFDSSNDGAKVRLSMYIAPVGHDLVIGQNGFLSQRVLSNATDMFIAPPM